MNDKFLPIGTVVMLKGGTKRVMITGYMIFSKSSAEKKLFDYGGCVFPEGMIDSSNTIGFNRNQIDQIIHRGLEDEEQKEFIKLVDESADEFRAKFEKEIANN